MQNQIKGETVMEKEKVAQGILEMAASLKLGVDAGNRYFLSISEHVPAKEMILQALESGKYNFPDQELELNNISVFEKITPNFVQLAKDMNLGIIGTSGTFYVLFNITSKGIIGIKAEGWDSNVGTGLMRIRVITNKVSMGMVHEDDYSYLYNLGWGVKGGRHTSVVAETQEEFENRLLEANTFIGGTPIEGGGKILEFPEKKETEDEIESGGFGEPEGNA
jgi:uncharacterized ubiquitin-like protein YukD